MTCRPNHPARHEPFEENNKLSLRHGAYSPTVIAEEASRVHSALLVECPWLDEPRYMPSLMRYLTASAREQLAHKALTSAAKFSPRLLEAATAAARLAWMMGDELGLTPAGHAKLKVLLADAIGAEVSVAQLVETGRQIEEARLSEMASQRPEFSPESGATDGDEEMPRLPVPGVVEDDTGDEDAEGVLS